MSLGVFLSYNLKVLFRKNLMAGLAYGLAVPFIFNLAHPIMISEVYLSPVGIIFLTQLSLIDSEEGMQELVSSRRRGIYYNFLTRCFLGLFFMLIVLGFFYGYLQLKGIQVEVLQLIAGTFITAVFLGMLGLTVANILKNYIAGYIISFSYYLFDFMTAGEYTGHFYLFSLSQRDFTSKYYLLALTIILFGINLLILNYRETNNYRIT